MMTYTQMSGLRKGQTVLWQEAERVEGVVVGHGNFAVGIAWKDGQTTWISYGDESARSISLVRPMRFKKVRSGQRARVVEVRA